METNNNELEKNNTNEVEQKNDNEKINDVIIRKNRIIRILIAIIIILLILLVLCKCSHHNDTAQQPDGNIPPITDDKDNENESDNNDDQENDQVRLVITDDNTKFIINGYTLTLINASGSYNESNDTILVNPKMLIYILLGK